MLDPTSNLCYCRKVREAWFIESTNSAIAVRNENGQWRGRYVHWDGATNGEEVRAIIARDGLQKAVQTLIFDHFGWSSVNAQQGTGEEEPRDIIYEQARFTFVPGYGIAYTPEEHSDDWITESNLALRWPWLEFIHIIEPDGSVTTTQIR